MRQGTQFRERRLLTSAFALAAIMAFAGCHGRGASNSNVPVNASPPKPVVRTPWETRHARLPLVDNWFQNHNQPSAESIADGDRLVVTIPNLKISPAIDQVAKEFAAAMGQSLAEA